MKKSALPTKSPRTSQESVEDRWDNDDWNRTELIEKDSSIEDVRNKDIVASVDRDENTMTLAERNKRFRTCPQSCAETHTRSKHHVANTKTPRIVPGDDSDTQIGAFTLEYRRSVRTVFRRSHENPVDTSPKNTRTWTC